jgi:hypothetical protein
MTPAKVIAPIVVWLALGGESVHAQDLSRYRSYALDSSLEAVISASGTRASDAKIRHERPARILELEWRAPYVSSGAEMADPVRTLTFLFYNDALYQITADYNPARIEGLTVAAIVATLSSTYGAPAPTSARAGARRAVDFPQDMTLLTAWESPATSVLLLRGSYSSGLQLVLVSKALGTQARSAIREAERLDVIDAPRRESERRKQEAVDADASRDKTRVTNKAAFRP